MVGYTIFDISIFRNTFYVFRNDFYIFWDALNPMQEMQLFTVFQSRQSLKYFGIIILPIEVKSKGVTKLSRYTIAVASIRALGISNTISSKNRNI